MQGQVDPRLDLYLRNSPVSITFTKDEAKRFHHLHFDALIVDLEVERHKMMRN